MFPKRADELLDGGSLYWTIASRFSVRQRIVGVSRVTGRDGISRCQIDFDRELVLVEPLARRPFQGWRYLTAEDAPKDLVDTTDSGDDALRRTLADLGLL